MARRRALQKQEENINGDTEQQKKRNKHKKRYKPQ
jgi:hypothetical protein